MKRLLLHISCLVAVAAVTSHLQAQTFPSIQQELRLFNAASSNYIGLTTPVNLGNTYNLVLPPSQGAAGSILTNNGTGTLSWTTVLPVANGGTGASTLTGILIGNGTSAITATTLSSGISGVLTDETGSGPLVFANSPTVSTLTVSSGGASITGATTINTTGTALTTIGNTGSSVTVGSIATALKTSVGSNDRIVLANSAGTLDQASISSVVAAGVSGSAWSLTGNDIGTSSGALGAAPTGSFLGTTAGNTQPLNIVTNNAIRMIVSSAGVVSTQRDMTVNGITVGQGANSGWSTAVGASALSNAGGSNNTAMGTWSLQNSTGKHNVAVGAVTGRLMTTGSNNVMIGSGAMQNAGADSNNVVIGLNALGNGGSNQSVVVGTNAQSMGNDIVVIGDSATTNNVASSGSVVIGAGANVSGTNSIAIGNNTASTGTNSIAIGNNTTSTANTVSLGNTSIITTNLQGNVLINNSSGNAGQVRFLEANANGANYIGLRAPSSLASDFTYTLPTTAPTAGQVLSSATDGTMSWSSISLQYFDESLFNGVPNFDTYAVQWKPKPLKTDVDVVLSPLGSGSLLANVPDNTTVGGNKRGTRSVDWQILRAQASQVASGSYSVLSGGIYNTASGPSSVVAGGSGNTASGIQSAIGGGGNNTASGFISAVGGGYQNAASDSNAVVVGGYANIASGRYSTVLGGRQLTISGNGSIGFNSSTGQPMSVSASGTMVMGNVNLWLANTDSAARELRFYEAQNSNATFPAAGTNYTAFKAGSQAADITYTLPTTAPTAGQVLSSATDGTMSWVSGLTTSSGWALTGNNIDTASGALGAAPTGKFLGTTAGNPQPLNIVTNNAIRMIVSSDGVVNTEKDVVVNGIRVGKGVAGGGGSVVLGANALTSATAGGLNTAIGVFTLQDATGAANTALGYMSGRLISTGTKNVTLGHTAGYDLAAGSENVLIGYAANLNSGVVNQAVVIGGPASGGSNSVVIGYNAQGGSNSIAIGNDLSENVAAANTAVIGRSAITLTRLYGTLRVNTIAGTAKTSLGSNDRILVASSDGSFDQASISTVVAAGISGSAWSLSGNSISDPSTQFLGTTSAQPLVIRTNNTEKVRVTSDGNVGIGTNSPSVALTVMGSANTLLTIGGNLLPSNLQWTPAASEKVAIFSGASGYATLVMADNGGEATGRVLGSLLFGQTLSGKSGNNPVGLKGGIQMYSTGSGGAVGGFGSYMSLFTSADNGNGYTERMRIGSTGHVGIGTGLAMPGARLHVGGGNVLIDTASAGTAGQLQFRNPAATFTTSIQAGAQTANITYTLPTAAPTLNNQVLTSTTAGVMSWATALTSASGWSITGNTGTDSTVNYIGTQAEATGRPLIVRTNGTERMRITGGSGFVGIGTTGPTAQLQVNPSSATVVGLNVRAASAQSANLVTIGNSAGTNVLQIGPTGNVNIGPFLAETGAADQPLRVLAMQTSVTGATEKDLFIGQVDHINQDPSFRLSLSNYNAADINNTRSQLNVKLRDGVQTIDQATTVLSLRSEGFVGINSSAPSTALDVTGTSTLRPAASGVGLSIRQNTGQSGSLVDIVSNGGTSLFTIGSSGAVTLLPFGTAAGSTNELRFGELAANGSHYVGLKGPNSISANVIWTLPSADGSNGQVLSTNGTGTLSWASALTSTSGWSTTGNAGTNSSTNFIGSTDSVDLVFRHNNIERMRMTSGGLRVSQGNGTPRSSIWAASFQNIGAPVYLELLNSDAVTNGGGMYMGMRGTGSVGDTATIWNWQGGPLAFYTNTINRSGLIRLFIDNDGDVGIGSHIPTQRLHVRGGNLLIDTVGTTGTVAGQLQMRNPAGTFQTNIQAGAQTSNITLTLPTSAPTSNGQVLTSTTGGVMSWSNALDGFWSTTGNAGTSPATNFIGTTDAQDVVLSRNSLERLRLTNSGVRVLQNGTPRSSTWALSVQNIFNSGTTNSALIEVLNTTSAVDGGGAHFGLKGTQSVGDTLGIWNFQGGPIKLFTSDTNRKSEVRMTVLPSGNVGVGNITPGTLLDVDGGLTVRPGGTITVQGDNTAVTIGNRSHVVLNSNGTPVNRTITISNGLQTGQIVFIMVTGTAAANGIELADDPAGSNTNLSGNAQLVDGAVLQLIWNGTDWMEVTRSNN